MEFSETDISGAFIITLDKHKDNRGSFIKSFHHDLFLEHGISLSHFKETYFSFSAKNVIRGMHFQVPPHQHAKLVYSINGCVLDVILDMRLNSPSYGKVFTTEISLENHMALYIPEGVAHGFCSLTDGAGLMYMVTSTHNKESDQGILYSSFGFDWNVDHPVLSARDMSFVEWKNFKTPF